MSRQSTFSSTIHVRDFVDAITDDPTRENAQNYVEIQTDINVFDEDRFYSPDIIVAPIRTRIRAYLPSQERGLYVPNAFFYTDGRFTTSLSADDNLEINIQALSLMRHPGDVAEFEDYRRHLPEKWCPMVTIIGCVRSPSDNSADLSEPRQFTIETSIYDASKAAPVQFSVACFLENTKRWQRVKIPLTETLLSITAKVAGRTTDTNLLALRVLDLTYLPRSTSATTIPTPATTPPPKRSARWDDRASSSTLSKKMRPLEPIDETINSDSNATSSTPPTIAECASPPTTTDVDDPSISTQVTEDASRPQRARNTPRKYLDVV